MNFFTKPILIAIVSALLFLILQSCDTGKQRFEDPPWLGGSSIETLKEKGNYSIFLELMEKANYTEPISKQLFTLFVPNDDAFKSYFSSRGINSVKDLSKDEAVELFTLHVLKNPRSRYQLIYEYAYQEEQGPNAEYASTFMRKLTNSTSSPYKEFPRYGSTFKDSIWIYSSVKEMPVFSNEWFEDVFGDLKGSDYLMMYPDGQWPSSGLCWGPAAVTDAETRTADGFIYFLDRVVPPQSNLEKYLKDNQDKYGIFYDLMQRFAVYNTPTERNSVILRMKAYEQVSNIANEEGPSTGDPMRMRDMFSIFLPNDKVFKNYLDNSFLKSFSSIDSIPKVTMYYIAQAQISNGLALISKTSKGYFNSFGDAMTITKDDIVSSHMCSNGVVYETNKIIEPNVFTCVPGKLFFDKNYSTFIQAIDASGLLKRLTYPDQDVTLFAPSNDQLEAYGIRYDEELKSVVHYVDNAWKELKSTDLTDLVQDHIFIGKISDLSGEGYLEMSSGNYIHYQNNKIGGCENIAKDKIGTVLEKNENERNGMLYIVNEPIMTNYVMGDYIYNNPEFSDFANLLIKVGFLDPKYVDPNTLDTVPNMSFLGTSQWTAFIPTNAAMKSARSAGLVPDETQKGPLRKFLQYHFVKNAIVFDDGKRSGVFETNRVGDSTTGGSKFATLAISNSPQNLQVTDHSGNTVAVYHADSNVLVRNGVVHKINSVLNY